MALKIYHVADFMGYQSSGISPFSFNIPSYQRGFRWERIQIEKLLDDLLEFSERIIKAQKEDLINSEWNNEHPTAQRPANNLNNLGFYCLQPLAVAGNDQLYDLIDGQQRLTTIYLILCYLSNDIDSLPYALNEKLNTNLFNLVYETRDDSFFKKKMFMSGYDNNPVAKNNIDFYFLAKGYVTIQNWFQSHAPKCKQDILTLLLPLGYNINDREGKIGINGQLHDVRFIWYETETNNSIQTFNDLNYGKIGLTPSELVKALLFQCDIYESENRDVARSIAFGRSTKWSDMEEHLQDKYFWGMLTPNGYSKDLHLELILRFVAEDIDERCAYSNKEGYDKNAEDWIFYIFSEVVSDNSFKDDQKNILNTVEQRIEYLWTSILKVYGVFKNWYSNRTLYHQIGLIVFLNCNYINKKDKNTHLTIIRNLYKTYMTSLKNDFEKKLKTNLGNLVRIKSLKNETIIDENDNIKNVERTKKLNEIRYDNDESERNELRKILLLFNVEMTIKNAQEESRFPFHLANENKLHSLEHIHPQNLDNDNIEFDELKGWLEDRKRILQENRLLDGSSPHNELADAVKRLDNNMITKESYEENLQQCKLDLEIVDKEFDDLAGMNNDVMHSLYNMALIDDPANSALGNGLLDEKRNKLKERTDAGKTYVPLGTWYAFNKHFSNNVKDLKFWSEPDRCAYFNAIKEVYEQYTN